MAIGRFGTMQTGMRPLSSPGGPQPLGGTMGKPATPTAMPPAGLPPDAYATVADPLGKPKVKPGPLAANTPRRITPAAPNPTKMQEIMGATQTKDQLSPDQVMGINNQDWERLLQQFGVFA